MTKHWRLLGRFGPESMHVLKLARKLHEDCSAAEPTNCKYCRELYGTRFRANWSIVMAMIDYASSTQQGSVIRPEYACISDIYHALGAARTAIATASIAVIGLNIVLADATTGVLPSTLIALLAYAQYQVLHSARESVSMDLTTRTAANLAWYSRLHSQPTPEAANHPVRELRAGPPRRLIP